MSFKIESGYEAPDRGVKQGRPGKYPFKELEIGQSFFVPEGSDAVNATSLMSKHNAKARVDGKDRRYVSQKTKEDGVMGRRFWCIAVERQQ